MVCNKCGGCGFVTIISIVTCPCCNGAGKMHDNDPCPKCKGVKTIIKTSQQACDAHDANQFI
jgi:DnaJ-class molecular chaperone